MKIAILTQPLRVNYGGLMQAYALQTVLRRMGHDVWTVDDQIPRGSLLRRYRVFLKGIYLRITGSFKRPPLVPPPLAWSTIKQHTARFVRENIRLTERMASAKDLKRLQRGGFDVFLVGSDQVWRPKYSPGVLNYFLDFLEPHARVKRIAFAASFGTDQWELTREQTIRCARLAKRFDAISVREDSGVTLCKQYLGVNAVRLPDPTLLLAREDYQQLAGKDNPPGKRGHLAVYLLDDTGETDEIVRKVADHRGLVPYRLRPQKAPEKIREQDLSKYIFPPVESWIRGLMEAAYVVTDSFHGTIFAIMFNKPFISVGNVDRGMTRFVSLCGLFGLENRLILPGDELTREKIDNPINFERVNALIAGERKKAMAFLNESISGRDLKSDAGPIF